MNDLISRKDAERIIHNYFSSLIDKNVTKVDVVDCNADLQKSLDNVPTAYNPDKVVGQLEELENHCLEMSDWQGQSAIESAIEIVKGGGISD